MFYDHQMTSKRFRSGTHPGLDPKRHCSHERELIRFKPICDGANLMKRMIHEVCSLVHLLDINRGFGLILTRSARYTGSVTGFRDTHLGQVAEPKGPKDEPPFMQKT